MIPIKIQCSCGQRFAFEVEPVKGQMPAPVTCPACGCDATGAANQSISQQLAAAATTNKIKRTEKWLMVTLCVSLVILVGLIAAVYSSFNRSKAAAPAPMQSATAEVTTVAVAAVPAPEAQPAPAPASVTTSIVASASAVVTDAPPAVATSDLSVPSKAPESAKSNSPARNPKHVAIGMLFLRNDKTHQVEVTRVIPNSPADKAGIVVGDVLLKVNGKAIESLPLKKVADMFYGPVGSKIKMEMIQTATGSTKHLKLFRERYAVR